MNVWEILILAVGLSMDAFAVSICKGLSVNKVALKHPIIAGLYFGGFQALMPLIGYFIGSQFASLINRFSHWIAFVLLLLIGANMIRESFGKEEEKVSDSFSFKTMLPMAIATSIDALAIGITFAFLKCNIVFSVTCIGTITFILSLIGVKIGNLFGVKYEKKAQLVGGLILILLGLKILLEHLRNNKLLKKLTSQQSPHNIYCNT